MQIERDPKTGNTTITSVTPVSTADGAPTTTTLFDDGRKSIHAVGAHGNQPSTEELGQILSMIDGIGMEMVLDNVSVLPNRPEGSNRAADSKGLHVASLMSSSAGPSQQVASCTSYQFDSEVSRSSRASATDNKAEKTQADRSIVTLEDIARETGQAQVQSLERDPVTLVFMGYRDSVSDRGRGDEVEGGMLTAERVMITDDGEEYVLGQEALANAQKDANAPVSEENGAARAEVQGGDAAKVPSESASPRKEKPGPGGSSRCRKCQCCVVM